MKTLRLVTLIAIGVFIFSSAGHGQESKNKNSTLCEIQPNDLVSRDEELAPEECKSCAWQEWKQEIEQQLEKSKQHVEQELESCATLQKFQFPQRTVTIGFTIRENNGDISQVSHAGNAALRHVIDLLDRKTQFPQGSTNKFADVRVQYAVKSGSSHFEVQHIHLHGRPQLFFAEIIGQ